MRTWDITVNKQLSLKVRSQKKSEGEALGKAINHLFIITAFRKELTGVYGESESEHLLMTIGSSNALENHARFTEERNEFLASIPPVIEEIEPLMTRARALFNKHVPVVNERITRQQADKEAEESKKIAEDIKARSNAENAFFIAQWGKPDEVVIPRGMMAVYLQITYDASHAMSDYYHPYAHIGSALLLGLVPEGKKMERTARAVLSRYPELLAHNWSFRRETWSMGNGTFLLSQFTGIKMKTWYGAKDDDLVDTRFQIRFAESGKTMIPYKNYSPSSYMPAVSEDDLSEGVTMTLNAVHQGVELRFADKPSEEVLRGLHIHRFRWHRFRKMWYAKQTEATLAFAREISGEQQPAAAEADEAAVIPEPQQPIEANVPEHHEEEPVSPPEEEEQGPSACPPLAAGDETLTVQLCMSF